ncbi:MAG: hypothetical protein LBE27_06845 [Deltaproteobacteria bacterium]|jgi:uncharacterized protein YfaS (alpha-2-macroglobulin family)|nr:hypothetical protein [Deltaproteobacteria bacterium]
MSSSFFHKYLQNYSLRLFLSLFLVLALSACNEETPPPAAPPAPSAGEEAKAMPAAETPAAQEAPVEAEPPSPAQSAPLPDASVALELFGIYPSGDTKIFTQVVAVFNQPMVALGDYDNVEPGALGVDPEIPGKLAWVNQYSLAFVPDKPLYGSLTLTATLDSSKVKSLTGKSLKQDVTAKIELPDLQTAFDSYKDTYGIDPVEADKRPQWKVAFNQPVDIDALNENGVFVWTDASENKNEVKATWIKDEDREEYITTHYVVSPNSDLMANSSYQIVLKKGLLPQQGLNPLPRDLELANARTHGPLDATLEINTTEENRVRRVIDPRDDSFYISFTNPVKYSSVLEHIETTPPHPALEDAKAKLQARNAKAGDSPSEGASDGASDDEDAAEADRVSSNFSFWPRFLPATEYTITLKAGLEDVFGGKLDSDKSFQVRTTEFKPDARFDITSGTIESSSPHLVPVTLTNLDETTLSGWALDEAKAVKFFAKNSIGLDSSGFYTNDTTQTLIKKGNLPPRPDKTLTLKAAGSTKVTPQNVRLDLDELFANDAVGKILFLALDDKVSKKPLVLQITNIGLTAKIGRGNSLVWTTELSSGKSLPGADVKLWSKDGDLLYEGTTDENGLAAFPGGTEILQKQGPDGDDSGYGYQEDLFVTANLNGDLAIWNLGWDSKFVRWNYDVEYQDQDRPLNMNENDIFLLTSQPVYKPGETLRMKLIVRLNTGDAMDDWTGPEGRIIIFTPSGTVFLDKTLEVSDFGTMTVEEILPDDAPYGSYSVYLDRAPDKKRTIPQLKELYNTKDYSYVENILVSAYRPPAFELTLTLPEGPAVAGDKEKIEISANYHYGAKAANLDAGWVAEMEPNYAFTLPGLSAYTLYNYYAANSDPETGELVSQLDTTPMGEAAGKLDSDGKLSFDIELVPSKTPFPRTLHIQATATDVDSRSVFQSTTQMVHPAKVYAGLKTSSVLNQVGDQVELDLIASDLDGKILPGQKVKLTLYRRYFTSTRRKLVGGVYGWVSKFTDEEIETQDLTTDSAPLKVSLTPPKSGFYYAVAETADQDGLVNQAATSFYAFGGTESSGWLMENDDSLNLVPDKTVYSPGDTAKILVQSPFSEGSGLLTLERGGVKEERIFQIDSQSPVLEIPLTEDDSPNVFVSVLLMRGRVSEKPDENNVDLGKPTFRLGYAKLLVPSQKDVLKVEATTAQQEYRPAQEVEIDIKVTDPQGQPFSTAELAVVVVDKAVIQLGGDDAFHPEKLFGKELPILVQTISNLGNVIGRRNWADKGGGAPAGGGGYAEDRLDGSIRLDFRTVPFFEGAVDLDDSGTAKLSFKLPDNLTTFKVYAVATGHGRLTGTGEGEFLVTQDLLLRSSLPKYASVNDKFLAGIIVTNRGDKSGQAQVEFRSDNLKLLDGEEDTKTVDVGPAESKELFFPVEAQDSSSAKVQFSVTMDDLQDRVEYRLPIAPAGPLVTFAAYNELLEGTSEVAIKLPEAANISGVDKTSGLSVEIAPSLAPTMKGPMLWLSNYPYLCMEQKTSKALASIYAVKLAPRLGYDEKEVEAFKSLVETHLATVREHEISGGFTAWESENTWDKRDPYLSAYVLSFLIDAKNEGYEVDSELIGRIQGYLTDSFKSATTEDNKGIDLRLFILYALTKSGLDTESDLEVFFLKKESLDIYGLSLLTKSVAVMNKSQNRTRMLTELIPLVTNNLEIAPGTTSVKNSPFIPALWLQSPSDMNAQILLLMTQASPYHQLLPSLARSVAFSAKDDNYGSTYRSATILQALSTFIDTFETEELDEGYSAQLGSKKLMEGNFSSTTDAPVSAFLPISELSTLEGPLSYTKTGESTLWAKAALSYRLKEADLSAVTQNGLVLSRDYKVIQPQESGPGVSAFQRGQVVRVTLTFISHVERYNLVLEDKIPAGFEVVDLRLRGEDSSLASQVADPSSNTGYRYWYDHVEPGRESVAVFAQYLPAGVYEFSYLVRPTTPGTYLAPGPSASEMYAPDNFGRGLGQLVTIEPPKEEAKAAPAASSPAGSEASTPETPGAPSQP